MLNLTRAATVQLHAYLLAVCGTRPSARTPHRDERDRGAVSLEQVLWFVAVAVSVGVIAAILWNRVFTAADQAELDLPVAPDGG